MSEPAPLAKLLADARATGRLIEHVPPQANVSSLAEAYEIARGLAGERRVAGWKVGATSTRGQQMLGLSHPFFGRIFAGTVLTAPAELALHGDEDVYAIEPEVGFLIGRDLPPRHQPYSQAEVMAAIDAVMPALELNRPSYQHPFDVGGLALIADNGVNVGACIGAEFRSWRDLDLSTIETRIHRNSEPAMLGSAAAVLGNPIVAVTWLANALPRWGCRLSAGQIVLSGATTPPVDARAGDSIEADFTQLGTMRLHVRRSEGARASGIEVMPRVRE